MTVPVEPVGLMDTGPSRPRPLPRSTIEVLTWDDLLAEPPEPPPVLEGTPIPKVGVTVLAGAPKVGKSLWSSQHALARRSTIIVEEGSMSGISYRLRRQWEAIDGTGSPDLVVVHRQRIRLDDRASVARLRDHVQDRRPELVVFDPLNRLHNADENKPTAMTPVMDALAGLAYDFGCAVLALHHTNKPSQDRHGSIWDTLRGASSIRSGTDANLILDGSGATIRLVGEFRDAEPLNEYLELDRDALIFHETEGPRVAGKVDQAALLTFIEEQSRVTVAEVAARFAVTKHTARTALEATAGLDSFDGTRGTRYYTKGTGQ